MTKILPNASVVECYIALLASIKWKCFLHFSDSDNICSYGAAVMDLSIRWISFATSIISGLSSPESLVHLKASSMDASRSKKPNVPTRRSSPTFDSPSGIDMAKEKSDNLAA
ncbi:hypothetical protein NC651_006186 [Populus alba x Populus x berolinensis]|nr:hypothetical protein NC651_006186 [Populus alba x Populus x berolinensis]